jgi:hypothetical protein
MELLLGKLLKMRRNYPSRLSLPIKDWTSARNQNPCGKLVTYRRPADWLSLPSVSVGEQKIVGLYAVYPTDANFCAFTCAGNYTVDWGDGSALENKSANALASHIFNYDDVGSGTESVYGYRQAIITIIPQVGSNLTLINFDKRHPNTSTIYSTQWLDIKMSGSNISTLQFYNGHETESTMLQRFDFVGTNNITNLGFAFMDCRGMFELVNLDTSKATSMQSTFSGCHSLLRIPLLKTSLVKNLNNCFYECINIQEIPLMDFSKVTDMTNCFYMCYQLDTVPLFNTANVINFTNVFYSCQNMKYIPVLNTSKGTNFTGALANCRNLIEVPVWDLSNATSLESFLTYSRAVRYFPLLNTSKCTNFNSMFYQAYNLEYVADIDFSKGTNFGYFLNACRSIKRLPNIVMSLATDTTASFTGCYSLQDVVLSGLTISISLANCNLGHTQLVAILNGLGIASAQTIILTGNPGVVDLTAGEIQVATDKGWSVTIS